MPRSIWSGAISFGLVNVPVKLYSAVQRKTVRFNQLDSEGHVRIQMKRTNPVTGEEVPYERLVKGYEIGPDRYVIVEPDELEALEPRRTKTIDILDFVELADIDPIFYDHPYYLAPGAGGSKPYKLLLDAMRETGIVKGRTLTSWPSLQTDIRNAGGTWGDEQVVVDGGLVTSRKPDDLDAFCSKAIETFAEGTRGDMRQSA